MSLCCFGGSSKKKKKSNFTELSQYLVDYAVKYRLHKRPRCPCIRKRLAYDVQWRHLSATTELLEFKIQPHDIYSGVLQDVTALKDATDEQNTQLEASGTSNSKDTVSVQPDDSKKSDSGTQEEHRLATSPIVEGNESDGQDIPPVRTREPATRKPAQDSGEEIVLLEKGEESTDNKNKEEPSERLIKKIFTKWRKKSQTKTARAEELDSDTDEEDTGAKSGQIDIRKPHKDTDKKKLIKHKPKQREVSLFKTEYTNTSGDKQKFTFHTERKTTSSMSINVQKSYTLGGELNLSMSLPVAPAKLVDPLSVTGALTGQYQLTKSNTESVQTEQMWSVNNDVDVGKGKKVIAEMRVIEEEAFATFRVKHTITPMPNATHIPIYVIHKSDLTKDPEDRKILDVFSVKNKNLYRAFDTDEAKQNGITVCAKTNSVEFVSEGAVKCVYQSKQMIDVREEDLSGLPEKGDKKSNAEGGGEDGQGTAKTGENKPENKTE